MAIIASARWRPGDREAWERRAALDLAYSETREFEDRVDGAEVHLVRFANAHAGALYAGVSWGKDSTALAHMICRLGLEIPLVWVRVNPISNPDCPAVRDEFIQMFPRSKRRYHEMPYRVSAVNHAAHVRRAFADVSKKFGAARVSGVRSEESADRKLRERVWGANAPLASAPFTEWTARDVWAYLAKYDLPIHPAYAMSFAGALDRDKIRVGSIGLREGRGIGRLEWESVYYPEMRRKFHDD